MEAAESTKLFGLNGRQWNDLAKRVSRGIAVDIDADAVERLGLRARAERIRGGLATHTDAVLINLEAQIHLQKPETAGVCCDES